MRPGNIPPAVLKDGDPCTGPPSPGVDVLAVLGVPKPKRPSERSQEEDVDEEEPEVDQTMDSDDDDEENQEGEYINLEDSDELKELQTQMLSENASLSRDMLVPIFKACLKAYDIWLRDQEASANIQETEGRRRQMELYRKVLDLYGSDAEWSSLTHAQRVERNKEAHDVSEKAKTLGPPPPAVAEALHLFENVKTQV